MLRAACEADAASPGLPSTRPSEFEDQQGSDSSVDTNRAEVSSVPKRAKGKSLSGLDVFHGEDLAQPLKGSHQESATPTQPFLPAEPILRESEGQDLGPLSSFLKSRGISKNLSNKPRTILSTPEAMLIILDDDHIIPLTHLSPPLVEPKSLSVTPMEKAGVVTIGNRPKSADW